LYPQVGVAKLKFPSTPSSEGGHRVLEDLLVSPTNATSRKKLDAIIEEAESYEGIHTVVISSETFSAPRVKLSTAIADVFRQYFSDTRILVYLRRQDDWAETFYKEVLCWSGRRENRAFKDFHHEFLGEWLDYGGRLEKWADIFGRDNLIVKSYDDREEQNIISDFYSTIGIESIDKKEFDFPNEINPSLPNDLVPLIIEINSLQLSRNQKSRLTQLVFHKLEASDYRVDRKPILSDQMLMEYKATFGPKNVELCRKYDITRNDLLTFQKNNERLSVNEGSLSVADVSEVQEMARAFSEQAKNTIGKSDHENRGRVGVSCLINENPLQTKIFVFYHLALGVNRIRIYFDDPNDPMADYDYGTDRVEVVKCDQQFWNKQLGREPNNNGEKLSTCHEDGLNYLNQLDDIDWVINLDGDELLYIDPHTTLEAFLSKQSKKEQIIVRPLEAVFVEDRDKQLFSAQHFKVPRPSLPIDLINEKPGEEGALMRMYRRFLIFLESYNERAWARYLLLKFATTICVFLPWIQSDEKLYQKYMPVLSKVMRGGFLAHREGRTFTRHGIELYEVKSHRPKFSGKPRRILRQNNTVFVLHYDAVDYSAWHLKWYRRVYGNTNASAIAEKRRMQQDMFRLACEKGEDALKKLFDDFFVFPANAIRKFQKAGLIVKLEQPLLGKVKKELMAPEH